MKVYIVMHYSFNDHEDGDYRHGEEVSAVCATKKTAIEYIKNFSTDNCWELEANCDYIDSFDDITGERVWDGDWYMERLYIEEWEVKES